MAEALGVKSNCAVNVPFCEVNEEFCQAVELVVQPGIVAILNVAVTVVLEDTLTLHDPVPEHPPPLQEAKVEPDVAEAVREMDVPEVTVSEQSAPQEIPVPVTVPDPVPALDIVRVKDPGGGGVPENSYAPISGGAETAIPAMSCV